MYDHRRGELKGKGTDSAVPWNRLERLAWPRGRLRPRLKPAFSASVTARLEPCPFHSRSPAAAKPRFFSAAQMFSPQLTFAMQQHNCCGAACTLTIRTTTTYVKPRKSVCAQQYRLIPTSWCAALQCSQGHAPQESAQHCGVAGEDLGEPIGCSTPRRSCRARLNETGAPLGVQQKLCATPA